MLQSLGLAAANPEECAHAVNKGTGVVREVVSRHAFIVQEPHLGTMLFACIRHQGHLCCLH